MSSLLIRGGTVVTMNPKREVFRADILIQDDRIVTIGSVRETAGRVIDATGRVVIPGLVQSHVHLCQTLFRNLADDLSLLEWLESRIWPLEAAHDDESIRLSARLGLLELIRGGTTAILDVGAVHHTEAVFEEIERAGIRAVGGKVMMDRPDDVPPGLQESLQESIDESLRLYECWNGAAGGRIGYALTPRFALSSTKALLQEVGQLSSRHKIIVHSHAAENLQEVEKVRQLFQRDNIQVFVDAGAADHHLCLAHCIWVGENEMNALSERGIHVLHCPSANLKLGSGVAPVPELLQRGVSVSLGADGAPCNNNLDAFLEMRLAALIQKPRLGPEALSAEQVFEMATLGGARALGLGDAIGSIEQGKKADLAILDLQKAHALPGPARQIYGQLVYSARSADVVDTIVDGRVLMADRQILTLDEQDCYRKIPPCLDTLLARADLP